MGYLEELSLPDEEGIVWSNATSSNGETSRTGIHYSELLSAIQELETRLKGSESKKQDPEAVNGDHDNKLAEGDNGNIVNAVASVWIDVHWDLRDWQPTKKAVQAIGITRYKCSVNPPDSKKRYTVEFTNVKGWRFQFKDQSDIVHSSTTISNGNHRIEFDVLGYDKSKPLITAVRN